MGLIVRSEQRFTTIRDGILSRHLLSFGDHYDPDRISVGPIMAHNDETLDASAGFDEHHHRDVDIVTWVVTGALEHRDPTGVRVITPGVVQRLSAGAGVTHAEVNADHDPSGQPLRFIQVWLRPGEGELTPPDYVSAAIDADVLAGGLALVASGSPDLSGAAPVTLRHRGATLHAGRIAAGGHRSVPAAALVHVFVVTGEVVTGSGDQLRTGDSLIAEHEQLALTATTSAELLVWTLDSR